VSRLVVAAVAGLMFGIGLGVSGMTDPAKVLAFLDVSGRWDPSLAFVMAGAIAVHAPVVVWLRRRGRPWIGDRLHLPELAAIDGRLLGGAALFGIGWGLAGYCPGPAVVAAAAARPSGLLVLAGMLVGMTAVAVLGRRHRAGGPP
jgi:uncharacterized membrane protein YedE/YeeE